MRRIIMNSKTALGVIMLALSTTAGATGAGVSPGSLSISGWLASRIVGAYQTEARVRVCGSSDPYETVKNMILFNAGGTVIAQPQLASTGLPGLYGPGLGTRGPDFGTWFYNSRTNLYSVKLRYETFVDGVFHGAGIVEREIQLSADDNTAYGRVHVTVLAPDGSKVAEICGTAVSTRFE